MLQSEIRKGGNEIIKTIFSGVTKSEDKEVWIKTLSFIDSKLKQLEQSTRGVEMFYWANVKFQMLNKFGKKFITNK